MSHDLPARHGRGSAAEPTGNGHSTDMSTGQQSEGFVPAERAHGADAPGLPAHRLRRTDVDPRAARRAERQVAGMFALSALATIGFVVAYIAVPLKDGELGRLTLSNVLLGSTLAVALFSIGAGAIHWAKKLMPDDEVVQKRYPSASAPDVRAEAIDAFAVGTEASGFGRRSLIRRSLIGALALLPLPIVVLLRDLGPLPGTALERTIFKKGVRLVRDVSGEPIRPGDLAVGSLVNAVPENLEKVEEEQGTLNERAKAAVILVRIQLEDIESQQGRDWDHDGILCFSKICPHVGCPISLYEQQTHHLLCPCHQSTFDLADGGNVIFGPAARRLPQLAITVDPDGYLVAQGDFAEPVGPSFWERG